MQTLPGADLNLYIASNKCMNYSFSYSCIRNTPDIGTCQLVAAVGFLDLDDLAYNFFMRLVLQKFYSDGHLQRKAVWTSQR